MIEQITLRRLWPDAPLSLVSAISDSADFVFERFDISTFIRAAHFMGQISHESDGGTITEESLDYTHAERIAEVWPTRFTAASAQAYVRNPRLLANSVYGGRMGNRLGTDDGFNYRGRGLLQITGRESYENIGRLCGLDLINHPEFAFDPKYALEVAACEFVHLGCLAPCDADDIRAVTRRVNGGYIGLPERQMWLARWKTALQGEPVIVPPVPAPVPPPVPAPVPQKTFWQEVIEAVISILKQLFRKGK